MAVEPRPAPNQHSRFDELWLPRIGPQAAALLRRSSNVALVVWPTCVVLAIGASFAFGRATPLSMALGIAAIVAGVAAYAVWVRSRRPLAVAMSEWFGVPLRQRDLPSMARVNQFDAWCRKRNLVAPAATPSPEQNPWV